MRSSGTNWKNRSGSTRIRGPSTEDPRNYTDYINGSVYILLTQSTLPKETNLTDAIARMRQIPQVVAAARQTIGHPPLAVLETAIAQNRGSIDFYEKEIFELAGETPQKDRPEEGCGRGCCLPQGLSGVPGKGRPPAGRRPVAAGQGEVRQEAGSGTRCRADGRPGSGLGRGRFRPRGARTLSHRKATLGPLLSARAVAAGQRGRASCRNPGRDQGRREGTWPAGGPDPRREGYGRADPRLHSRAQDPAPARSRSLPGDRDAGVQAGQFDGLHGCRAAAGRRRPELLCRQPAAQGLGRGAGPRACCRNTTATCSRC